MKKKALPVLVVIGLILLIIGGIFIASAVKKYSPSKERADLMNHYNLSDESSVAISVNYSDVDFQGRVQDGHVYVSFDFVHDFINPRFYYDSNESLLLYTNVESTYQASLNDTTYLDNKNSVDFGSVIAIASDNSCLINLDYVKQFSNMQFSYYEDPNRVAIITNFGTINVATCKKDTSLRELGGIKSPIMKDVKKGDSLIVINEDDTWSCVMTEDALIGYIKNSTLKDQATSEVTSDYVEPTVSHNTRDHQICLGWQGIYNSSANNNVSNILNDSKCINVIAPTWFYVNDDEGNLHDMASASYVSTCHDRGVEVWATVNNIENGDVDTTYILTHTSVRTYLENQIVSAAIQYNLDGINLDFEAVNPEVGDGYIQFVRELANKLRNNGIVLSIDNYVPTEYTKFYNRREQAIFADYIVIMGYDQHYAGSDEAGSVAALDWVTEGVNNTIDQGVPSDRIILGMPFYTRLWCESPQGNVEDGDDAMYSVSSSALTMSEAAALIKQKGAEKSWLTEAGQFYARYEENKNIYEIWLEDNDSLEEKLKLMQSSELAGCAFWRLGFETSSTWDTISKYIQ